MGFIVGVALGVVIGTLLFSAVEMWLDYGPYRRRGVSRGIPRSGIELKTRPEPPTNWTYRWESVSLQPPFSGVEKQTESGK
jgi:hypothetical protein